MKTKIITAFLLAASGFMPGVVAQTPSTPAPVVAASSTTDSASAPSVSPAPNQIVYAPRLPSAQELSNVAAAQGLTVTKIEQTSTQVTATYQAANGQTNVVAYLLLPTANASTSVRVVTTPPPTVVYTTPAPRVVYYDSPGYYDPWYWYPPVSLSLGFGFHGGGGYYRGGYGHGFYHRHR